MITVRILLVTIITLSTFGTIQAASLNNAMQDCAKIKRDLKRLSCFDKLSGRVDSFAVEQMAKEQINKVETITKSVTPTVAAKPETPESEFGLEAKSKADMIDVIKSYIPGEFKGWRKDDEIILANGQIWQVVSGSLFHKASNPKVEIRRGLFDSFRMKVIGMNKTAQVKRIK